MVHLINNITFNWNILILGLGHTMINTGYDLTLSTARYLAISFILWYPFYISGGVIGYCELCCKSKSRTVMNVMK